MIVTNVARGKTQKVVTVEGITFDDSTRKVLDAAYSAAGETREACFGHNVKPICPGTVQVAIYTD